MAEFNPFGSFLKGFRQAEADEQEAQRAFREYRDSDFAFGTNALKSELERDRLNLQLQRESFAFGQQRNAARQSAAANAAALQGGGGSGSGQTESAPSTAGGLSVTPLGGAGAQSSADQWSHGGPMDAQAAPQGQAIPAPSTSMAPFNVPPQGSVGPPPPPAAPALPPAPASTGPTGLVPTAWGGWMDPATGEVYPGMRGR